MGKPMEVMPELSDPEVQPALYLVMSVNQGLTRCYLQCRLLLHMTDVSTYNLQSLDFAEVA